MIELMSLAVGQRGYLQLGGSFSEPRWREALIVATDNSWVRTLVRCSTEEVEDSQLSAVTSKGIPYCFVEAEDRQIRLGVHGGKLMLDADISALLELARKTLESGEDDVNFATASEPGQARAAKARARRKVAPAEVTESSGASQDEEDA